jgi:predicted secreted protein
MPYTKRAAKGTLLQYESAPTVFTTIPGVGDFNVPLGEKDEIDVTTHDSGGYEETVLGIGRLAAFDVPMMWDGSDTTHQAILAAHDSDTAISIQITTVDLQVVTGNVVVKNITFNAPVNGKFDASTSFKWTAKPTVTAPV